MFPSFRIVSDGPLASTSETFISNESFYSGQRGATDSPSYISSDRTLVTPTTRCCGSQRQVVCDQAAPGATFPALA